MNKIKKSIALAALLFTVATVSHAQIFMTDDELGPRFGAQDPNGVIPLNGVNFDQTNEIYTPIGDGLLIMTAFGAAYLLNRKRRNNKHK